MNAWKGIEIPAVKSGRNKGVLRNLRKLRRLEAEARNAAYRERKAGEWRT